MQTCKHTHGCKMWPNKMNLYIHKPMQEACGIPFLFSKIRRTLLSTAALEGLITLQCMIHQQYSNYSYPSGIKSGGEGMKLGGGNMGRTMWVSNFRAHSSGIWHKAFINTFPLLQIKTHYPPHRYGVESTYLASAQYIYIHIYLHIESAHYKLVK